jgi:hypothetical protein
MVLQFQLLNPCFYSGQFHFPNVRVTAISQILGTYGFSWGRAVRHRIDLYACSRLFIPFLAYHRRFSRWVKEDIMTQIFSDFWNILKLDGKVLNKIGDDKTGLWTSLRLFIVISLLITFGGLVSSLSTEPQGIGTGIDSLEVQLNQLLARRLPPSLENYVANLSDTLQSISNTLEQYSPTLGKETSYTLRAIGKWLSSPLTFLGGWMAAALAVFLVAKVLKGQGELRNHVNVFLLGFTPQILLVISSFAFLHSTLGWIGSILAFVAFFWSLAVLIAGMRNVHQITAGKSIAVLVVTFLVFAFLLPAFSILLSSIVMMIVFRTLRKRPS